MPPHVPCVGSPPGEPAPPALPRPTLGRGACAPSRPARWARRTLGGLATLACAALIAGCSHDDGPWRLTDVSGHLPDLAFRLTEDSGKNVDATAFRGHTTLVYFGYTHCPDVCPETMARLMQVLEKLPASDAKDVRILFISVDPARDTPQALHAYVTAFDAQHIRGLTGTDAQVESLAKRWRVSVAEVERSRNATALPIKWRNATRTAATK